MFQETYRKMNEAVGPTPALAARTVARTKRRPRLRGAAVAAVAALALCVGTPVAAATVEPVYRMLYQLSPAAAQLFQPVRRSCADGGITMEVEAVSVEGSRAHALIALSGGAVDETADLFDSYSFRLPFDQASHCRRAGFDPKTKTAYFQITTQTLDGSPIPVGGKMTVSLNQILSGKTASEDLAVELNLGDWAQEARTAPVWSPGLEETAEAYSCTGGGGDLDGVPMLLPGEALAEPVPGITVTAAGYAQGYFQIQTFLQDRTRTDNHCFLWLEDEEGNRLQPLGTAYFTGGGETERRDYLESVFDVSPQELSRCTLHGDFYTASTLTEGDWRVTFPLENT